MSLKEFIQTVLGCVKGLDVNYIDFDVNVDENVGIGGEQNVKFTVYVKSI